MYPDDGKYVVSATLMVDGIVPLDVVVVTGFWMDGFARFHLSPARVKLELPLLIKSLIVTAAKYLSKCWIVHPETSAVPSLYPTVIQSPMLEPRFQTV